jgi:TRAP-type C4-dicarboxylate transport system permease small subunit
MRMGRPDRSHRLHLLASGLVLPLALLLCLQWPLREVVQAGSRQANDLAQLLFAFYMAVAVSAATRAGQHLSARHDSASDPTWRRVAVALCTLPWSLWLLWTTGPLAWQSLRELERFPESFLPGYFLIKCALWLMAVLCVIDSLLGLRRPAAGTTT